MTRGRKSSSASSDINLIMIPVSIVTGIIAWFLGNNLYSSMVDLIPRPMVIGVVFTVLYVLLMIVVVIVAVIQHEYQGGMIPLLG